MPSLTVERVTAAREVEEQWREGEVVAKKSLGRKQKGGVLGMQMVREDWFQKI